MKIGLIQTRGIGDIVIAAPIAQYYVDLGYEVVWPVDARFIGFVQAAFPEIRFIPIDREATGDATLEYFFQQPLIELAKAGCDHVFSLYSNLSGIPIINEKFARSLKFDEYKYAVSGVSFDRKWQLRIARDRAREQALFDRLEIRKDYVLVHEYGSDFHLDIQLPADVVEAYQVVKVSEISNNPFDWLGVMERATMFACVDSCFANLAEQLDLCPLKFLFLRSDIRYTPVFRSGWKFM